MYACTCLAAQFKKDFKVAVKRNKNIAKLQFILEELQCRKALPTKNRNHPLKGNYVGYWECHIELKTLMFRFVVWLLWSSLRKRGSMKNFIIYDKHALFKQLMLDPRFRKDDQVNRRAALA